MMTSRRIHPSDKPLLEDSLRRDPNHKDTDPTFFYAFGSVCNVYEDEAGPVLFCRGAKALRIDIQFLDNADYKRNRNILLNGFPDLVSKAKDAGFTEIIFFSSSPLLIRFCTRELGFHRLNGELRKLI